MAYVNSVSMCSCITLLKLMSLQATVAKVTAPSTCKDLRVIWFNFLLVLIAHSNRSLANI